MTISWDNDGIEWIIKAMAGLESMTEGDFDFTTVVTTTGTSFSSVNISRNRSGLSVSTWRTYGSGGADTVVTDADGMIGYTDGNISHFTKTDDVLTKTGLTEAIPSGDYAKTITTITFSR